MKKVFSLAALALIITIASVFVNFGQMFWSYSPNIKTDRYRGVEIYKALGDNADAAVERRSGAPLSVMSIQDRVLVEVKPRSVFDIEAQTRWNASSFVFNFVFWFIFVAGGFFILKKSRAWHTATKVLTIAALLFLMVAAFSIRIAPDFLIIAAPFQIWNHGSFSGINLLLSLLVFVLIASILVSTWETFTNKKPWQPTNKTFALLGASALVSLTLYFIVASVVTKNGITEWDQWLLSNIVPDKPYTLWSDVLLPLYDLSPYLLFFIPAVATAALWQSGNRRLALIPLPALNISYFVMPFLKTFYNHPRPDDMFIQLGETAFPGGFATLTVVFIALGIIAFLLNRKWRYPALGLGLSLLLCYAWVGMHVHWVGDFIGGYFLGFAIYSAIALLVLPLKFIEQNSNSNQSAS